MEGQFGAYINMLQQTKSPDTVRSYENMLKGFERFLASYSCPTSEFTVEDVLEYVKMKSEWKPNSKNHFLATVKGYARYAFARIEMGTNLKGMQYAFAEQRRLNLIKAMPRYKVPREFVEKAISVNDLSELLHTAFKRSVPTSEKQKRTRHGLISHMTWKRIWLMWYLGGRKVELQKMVLDKRTFDPKTGMLILKTAKGKEVSTERMLFLEPGGTLELMRRVAAGTLNFGTHHDTLNKMLIYVREKTTIATPVTPHTARYTFITEMRKTLKDDILVKALVGHSAGGDMTAVYTSYKKDDLKTAMVKKHYMRGMFTIIREWLRKEEEIYGIPSGLSGRKNMEKATGDTEEA